MTTEIVFEVREDEADGGFTAAALGHDIFNVREAVQCHFGNGVPDRTPRVIRLHIVRDEVFAA